MALWQRRGMVVVMTMAVLVIAAISFVPFVSNSAMVVSVGDRPSLAAKGGFSSVCPSDGGEIGTAGWWGATAAIEWLSPMGDYFRCCGHRDLVRASFRGKSLYGPR